MWIFSRIRKGHSIKTNTNKCHMWCHFKQTSANSSNVLHCFTYAAIWKFNSIITTLWQVSIHLRKISYLFVAPVLTILWYTEMYKVFLLSVHWAWKFDYTESLHLLGHPVTPAVLRARMKETQCVWESEHLQHWIQKKLFPLIDKYSYHI